MAHPPIAPDVLLGRWLAFCAHPARAARVLPPAARCLLVATWFGLAYAGGLVALFVLRP